MGRPRGKAALPAWQLLAALAAVALVAVAFRVRGVVNWRRARAAPHPSQPRMAVVGEGRMEGSQMTRGVPAGVLYSWGLDASWRLGRVGGAAHYPQPALPGLAVMSAAASRHSLVALAPDAAIIGGAAGAGGVWSMGNNDSHGGGGHGSEPIGDSGQLGRGGGQRPAPVEGLPPGVAVVQVAAGRYHSVALTADGRVLTWGLNDWGQLGRRAELASSSGGDDGGDDGDGGGAECTHGARCRSGAPRPAELPPGVLAAGVSAGRYSTQVMSSDGALWVFGLDGCAASGQLPPRPSAYLPRRIGAERFGGARVAAVSTGYVFWVAADEYGRVYTCGTGDDGYAGTLPNRRAPNAAGELGRGGPPGAPGRVEGVARAAAVAAGREHALVVTRGGDVYSWGGGGRGDRAIGRAGRYDRPGLVKGALAGRAARLVAAGEYYSLAATDDAVFGWGSNAYATTGAADPTQPGAAANVVPEPTPVLGELGSGGRRVYALAAGYQHALAVVEGAPVSGAGGGAGMLNGDADSGGGGGAGAASGVQAVPGVEVIPAVGAAAAAPLLSAPAREQAAPAAAAAAHDPASYLAAQARGPSTSAAAAWAAWRPGPEFDRVRRLSPDVFDRLPRAFNPEYRNPCWGAGPNLTCIPYFHIIGVSKCGTTDLYHRLVMHRGVLAARNKGPHFWDECPYPPAGPCGVGGAGDFGAYVKLFSLASDIIRGRPDAVTGEASSNTYTSANGVYARGPAMARPGGSDVTMPLLLREAAPYLRLILMLRDPGDRLYSAYHYYRWWQKDLPPPSPQDFHNQTTRDIAAWHACVEQRGRAACVQRYDPQQLIKGMYGEFLQDWLAHWPREQLLILRYEDYTAAPEAHLRAALAFLGVSNPDDGGALGRMLAEPVRNRGGNKRGPMLPETRELLDDFYAPFSQPLAAALGDDRWRWAPEERAAREAREAGEAGGATGAEAGRRRRRRGRRRG